jgi:hypothetical protein
MFRKVEQIARCNKAMLNEFEGMTQDEMMECADLLENPLKRLEEETKAKEEAEKEAARKAKVEAEKKAAAIAAAKKKQEEEAQAAQLVRQRERAEAELALNSLKEQLSSCEMQYTSALVASQSAADCNLKLNEFDASYVPVDPRLKPLFLGKRLEVILIPVFVVLGALFWLLGCFVGSSRVTPIVNPTAAGAAGVYISNVQIRPGNEVCIIKNNSFADVVS